ncbi:hypothetical protein EV702DRAFT_1047324 [Suillus placidus]|uniref:Uncharacterized protein n=1 Tax=Suillus placidus TaxID=48579 RepID=A0A9P6ZSG7_9AGAM|nr:hypothetical protein EV702DRAFT_1047324 [Suillus placidus]
MAVVCQREEDNDFCVSRIRSCVPPALTSSTTTAESYWAFCHDLDGGLNELSEDIFSILSKPCFLGDMLTLLMLCNKNRVYVSLAPSYAHAEGHNEIVFYEGKQSYARVAGAIADDCNVFFYRGILYNIPANTNSTPPFTCITSGRYIGVFSGEIRKFLRELNMRVFSSFNVAVLLRSCTQIHARTAIHFTCEDVETFKHISKNAETEHECRKDRSDESNENGGDELNECCPERGMIVGGAEMEHKYRKDRSDESNENGGDELNECCPERGMIVHESHDENMLALGKSADSDMSAKTPIDSEPSEETDREDQDQVTQDKEDKDQNDKGERNLVGDFRMEWLNDLYHIGPQEDNQTELLKDIGLDTDVQAMSRTSPSLSDEATTLSSFENFNLWTTDMEGFDNRLTVFENSFHPNLVDTSLDTSFHQPQHNSFHYASPHFDFGNFAAEQNPDYPIENFFFNASYPYGDQTSLPVEPVLSVVAPHNAPSPLASNIPTPDIRSSPVVTLLPVPPANVQCHQANEQMNNNAVGRPTTGLTDEGQSDEAPRRTARQHVPSNCARVLNAIGSLNARVCVTTREAKENDALLPVTPAVKCKAKSINQSNK